LLIAKMPQRSALLAKMVLIHRKLNIIILAEVID